MLARSIPRTLRSQTSRTFLTSSPRLLVTPTGGSTSAARSGGKQSGSKVPIVVAGLLAGVGAYLYFGAPEETRAAAVEEVKKIEHKVEHVGKDALEGGKKLLHVGQKEAAKAGGKIDLVEKVKQKVDGKWMEGELEHLKESKWIEGKLLELYRVGGIVETEGKGWMEGVEKEVRDKLTEEYHNHQGGIELKIDELATQSKAWLAATSARLNESKDKIQEASRDHAEDLKASSSSIADRLASEVEKQTRVVGDRVAKEYETHQGDIEMKIDELATQGKAWLSMGSAKLNEGKAKVDEASRKTSEQAEDLKVSTATLTDRASDVIQDKKKVVEEKVEEATDFVKVTASKAKGYWPL